MTVAAQRDALVVVRLLAHAGVATKPDVSAFDRHAGAVGYAAMMRSHPSPVSWAADAASALGGFGDLAGEHLSGFRLLAGCLAVLTLHPVKLRLGNGAGVYVRA